MVVLGFFPGVFSCFSMIVLGCLAKKSRASEASPQSVPPKELPKEAEAGLAGGLGFSLGRHKQERKVGMY